MPQTIIRAAGYIRLSEPKKQEKGHSKQFQESKIRERCCQEEWSIRDAHIFYDGFRGIYWREREGLQAMLACARRHEFDVLLLYDLDRLAREANHQIIILEELTYLGVKVVILDPEQKRVADGTFEGDALAALEGIIAAEEHRKRIRRVHDGVEQRTTGEKKIMPSYKPLYGYRWDDPRAKKKNKYVIYEDEAEVVRRIFMWKIKGITIQQICIMLAEEGIPTPNGKRVWQPQVVWSILTHPSYKGKAYALRHQWVYVPSEGKSRMKHVLRPPEEWVALPDGTIPAIVSEDTWDEVQRQLQRNKEQAARRNKHPEAALARAGVAICGVCGANMSYKKRYGEGGGRDHYRCIKQSQLGNTCRNSVISVKTVDDAVWEACLVILARPERIERALEARLKGDNPNAPSLENLDRLILKAGAKIQNLMESMEDETDKEVRKLLSLRIRDLNAEKQGFEEERDKLARATIQWEEANKALQKFKVWCHDIYQRVKDGFDAPYSEKREAVDRLGLKITVYPVHVPKRCKVTYSPPEIMEHLGVPLRHDGYAHTDAMAPLLTLEAQMITAARSSPSGVQ